MHFEFTTLYLVFSYWIEPFGGVLWFWKPIHWRTEHFTLTRLPYDKICLAFLRMLRWAFIDSGINIYNAKQSVQFKLGIWWGTLSIYIHLFFNKTNCTRYYPSWKRLNRFKLINKGGYICSALLQARKIWPSSLKMVLKINPWGLLFSLYAHQFEK